jgi:hypothetical protein
MALPGPSGSISMSQINTELGRSSTASISLDTAENGGYGGIQNCSPPYPSSGNPARMSEWFGYNHNVSCAVSCGGGFNTYATQVDCANWNYRQVNLGGYTSGTVSVGWTISKDPSFGANGLRVYVVYNGTTVADTGNVQVGAGEPNSKSGTLTFSATGADNKYFVYFIDAYCY